MQFISFVGTQPISVINPCSFIFNKDKFSSKLSKISLLHTGRTKENVERIKYIFLREYSVSPNIITSYEADKNPEILVNNLIKEDNDFIFNLDGGLNFQIIKTIDRMENNFLKSGKFVYSDNNCIILIENIFEKKEKRTIFNIKNIPIENLLDILELNRAGGTLEFTPDNINLKNITKSIKSKYSNVEFLYNVNIEGIHFNLIYNIANTLYFILFMNNNNKALLRKIIGFVKDRNYLSQFYHKEVYIITKNYFVKDRIEDESGGKIKIFTVREFYKNFSNKIDAKKLKRETIINKDKDIKNDYHLLLFAATNIMPTLKAISSIQPAKLTIFYTYDNEYILRIINSIKNYYNLLNAGEIEFIPVDFYCQNFLEYKDNSNLTKIVNATPGTKLQSFYLTLWAKINNGITTTIKNRNNEIVDCNDKKIVDVLTPSPIDFLKFNGINIKAFKDKKEILSNSSYYNSLEKEIKNSSNLTYWKKIKFKGQGYWYEYFTAFKLIKYFDIPVFQGVKYDWNFDITQFIKDIEIGTSFKTDIDVVASYNENIYVISCKTGEYTSSDLMRFKREIAQVSKIFGTFGIPLLSYFDFRDEFQICEKTGVGIFGIDVLLDKDKVEKMLKQMLRYKSTLR